MATKREAWWAFTTQKGKGHWCRATKREARWGIHGSVPHVKGRGTDAYVGMQGQA